MKSRRRHSARRRGDAGLPVPGHGGGVCARAERCRDVGDAGGARRRRPPVGARRVPVIRAARHELPRPKIVLAEVQLRHQVPRRDTAGRAAVLPQHVHVRARAHHRRRRAQRGNRRVFRNAFVFKQTRQRAVHLQRGADGFAHRRGDARAGARRLVRARDAEAVDAAALVPVVRDI